MVDDLPIDNVLLSQFPGEILWLGRQAKKECKTKKIKIMIRQILTRWITRIIWIVIIGYFLQTTGGMVLGIAMVLFLIYYLIRVVMAIAYVVATFFFIILILGLIIF